MSELGTSQALNDAKQQESYKRALWVLSVLLLAQIAVAVAIYAGRDQYEVFKPNRYLLSTDFSRLSHFIIESDCSFGKVASRLELKRSADSWLLPGYFNFPVSNRKVEDFFAKLKTFKKGFPVAETSDSSRRFRVAPDEFERSVHFFGKELVNNLESKDEVETALYLADSPAYSRSYARINKEAPIYLVEFSASQLGSRAEDWIDRSYLEVNPVFISSIDCQGLRLQRKGKKWQLEYDGKTTELTEDAAKLLLDPIGRLSITSVLAEKNSSGFSFAKPILKITLKLSNGKTRTYEFVETKDSNISALKVDTKTLIFGVDSWRVDGLLQIKAADLIKASSEKKNKPKTERQVPGQQVLQHRVLQE